MRRERPAQQARTPERREQSDPRHRGRKHERELHQSEHERPPAEAPPRQRVRGRRSDEQHECVCDRARLHADDERVANLRIAELREQMTRRRVQEQRDERQDEECERDCEGRAEQRAERDSHGSPKPAAFSFARPAFESTRCTNRRASARCRVVLTIASS